MESKIIARWHVITFTCILAFLVKSPLLASDESGVLSSYFIFQDTIPKTTQQLEDSLANVPYKTSTSPSYRGSDRYGDPFSNYQSKSPLLLNKPSDHSLEYDLDTGMNYTIYEQIGELNYKPPTTMSFDQFNKYQTNSMVKNYWQVRSSEVDGESSVGGRRLIPKIYMSPVFDRIFGGSFVEINPRGLVNLDFSGRFQKIANPALNVQQQKNGSFEFDMQISMNVMGKIGEKLKITANFDNNNSFDFQNNMKIEFTGFEEDIIKSLEVGNVSLPISNSLMNGAQNLFGVKTQLQFGKLFVTGVASTQRGKHNELSVDAGGVQGREFEIKASDYDENRHFFLGHFFRDNYKKWLNNIPQIASGIKVSRVEVYVINRNNDTETQRNIVAFLDLAEPRVIYQKEGGLVGEGKGDVNSNEANDLYDRLRNENRDINTIDTPLESKYEMMKATHYDKINSARKLSEREYTFHDELGYISLQSKLRSDEVLAVSYEYSYNGRVYKVGELTEDYSILADGEVIFMKMLRPSKIAPRDQLGKRIPSWDLMMKNVYSLNASQVSQEGFEMRIIYRDDRANQDKPSINEGVNTTDIPLIELMGLDRLNQNGDVSKDGNFDFVDNVTINTTTGTIFFPVLEPFGDDLENQFEPFERELIQRYVYDTLYGTTRAESQQDVNKNKYFLKGVLKSGSSSEILLDGIKIAEGSIRVTSGGRTLTEGEDYTVDYNFGKVQIINESIANSGQPIKVSYETADMFNFQSRSLLGARFDYKLHKDIDFGATILHHVERPYNTRPGIGAEPPKNTKYGFDLNYNKESVFLTKLVDALPFLDTKEPSIINFSGEFAQLLPSTSNQVNGEGTSYVDDFETSITPFTLGNNQSWKHASTPLTENNKYDLSNGASNDLKFSYKRARFAWYNIDINFYSSSGRNGRPDNISEEDMKNHYVRQISRQEIFPEYNREAYNPPYKTFDMAYFPDERGIHNYNPDVTLDGALKNPKSNWGGVTTAVNNEVDFDKSNIQYIEFWLMDPFIEGPNGIVVDGKYNTNNTTGGKLVFNLGSVSEDIMNDGKLAFENGLPEDGKKDSLSNIDVTANNWGYVTQRQYLNNAFGSQSDARRNQDLGLDGLNNEEEEIHFKDRYLDILNTVSSEAINEIKNDPSSDDFKYFFSGEHDDAGHKALERYKFFNGTDKNSPILTSSTLSYSPSSYTTPDIEDLNKNNSLDDLEEYYEYNVDLEYGKLNLDHRFIVDKVVSDGLTNGTGEDMNWYLFRIPIRQPDNVVGNISGFKSIRYIRTYLTGWSQPVVLRTANFRMVGSNWREYEGNLENKRFDAVPELKETDFTISVVNIEENSQGDSERIPYTLPPGIIRDRDNTSLVERRLNEQSIQLCVEDMEDKNAKAAFKNLDMNLVNYGRVKMFFHAESSSGTVDDEVRGFLRLGTGFDNYYEIELPLKITQPRIDITDREIWPLENEINVPFEELYKVKKNRNLEEVSVDMPYSGMYNQYKITIVGNPKLSTVTTMLIGMRNPESIDERSHSVCIWANELRVTEFNTQAGWAANANLNAKLADFATVNASTRYSSFGYGNIQSKIGERTQEASLDYDVSGTVNIDKFLPSQMGIKIPLYASYEKRTMTPEYDPLDSDIPLESNLLTFDTEEEASEYKNKVIDQTERRSLNFSNVRKERTNPDKKEQFYNIENISISGSYSDRTSSNYNMESYKMKNYSSNVNYNFNPKELSIAPFEKSKVFSSSWLKLIKDLNINLMPSNLNFRGQLDRRYVKSQYRNKELTSENVEANYEKTFTIDRIYGLKWNLTKAISLDYSARANAIIDEPEGDVTDETKEIMLENLKNLGRFKRFNQDMGVNLRLPLDKLPITDWANADFRYSVGYKWASGSLTQIDSIGHKIDNNRTMNAAGKFDLVKLYNKIPYLKTINTPQRRKPPPRQQTSRTDTVKNNIPDAKFAKGFLRTLMMLRSVNMTYDVREGTMLPGFKSMPYILGMDTTWSAPGWGFLMGSQDPTIRHQAGDNGWLVKSESMTNRFKQMQTIDLKLKATIEPLKDLKVQVDMWKRKNAQYEENYRFNNSVDDYESFNPTRSGSYEISYMMLKTTFDTDDENDESPVFEQFLINREILQTRLGSEYDLNHQDVLIPSFLAAYSGLDANAILISPFPKMPMPNWRADYGGLGKLEAMRKVFSSVTISHGYTSSFGVGNYTNPLANAIVNDLTLENDIENYVPARRYNTDGDRLISDFSINQVMMTERFAPLLKISVRTRTRLNGSIEYKTERSLSLNLANAQITELNSKDFVFSLGFTKDNVKLPFKVQGRTTILKNDLDFRLDLTVKDSKTILRNADANIITNGNVNFQLRPNIGYALNDRLTLQFYYEQNINAPRISTSFKRTTSSFGVQVRFSLAQ